MGLARMTDLHTVSVLADLLKTVLGPNCTFCWSFLLVGRFDSLGPAPLVLWSILDPAVWKSQHLHGKCWDVPSLQTQPTQLWGAVWTLFLTFSTFWTSGFSRLFSITQNLAEIVEDPLMGFSSWNLAEVLLLCHLTILSGQNFCLTPQLPESDCAPADHRGASCSLGIPLHFGRLQSAITSVCLHSRWITWVRINNPCA